MDIQNILYFLAIVGLFLYRTWQNYQKQQAENSERQLGKPMMENSQQQTTELPANKKYSLEELLKDLVDEPVFQETSYEKVVPEAKAQVPVKEPVYQPMRVERPIREERVAPVAVEPMAAEVAMNRAIHQKHKHGIHVQEEEEMVSEYAHFDLRDAIIKSVILERKFA